MQMKRYSRNRILVVDDDRALLSLQREILSREGFSVLVAASGAECLKLAAGKRPDLILLDIYMPGKDGGEVARELASDGATKDIPVMFLTGIVTGEELGRGEEKIAGRFYISKTAGKDELVRKIKEILEARGNAKKGLSLRGLTQWIKRKFKR